MAFTDTWNSAFESVPADTEAVSQGAERIRDLKVAISERMSVAHFWDGDSNDGVLKGIVGEVKMWPTGTAPTGWLICDGQAVSRTTYSDLFGVLGTTYGNGDGSTTFNLPDFRGKSPLGANRSGLPNGGDGSFTTRSEGDTGGEEDHQLTEAELANHTHGNGSLAADSNGNHNHNTVRNGNNNTSSPSVGSNEGIFEENQTGGNSSYILNGGGTPNIGITSTDGAHTHNVSGSTGPAGSNNAHNTMHPFLVINFIIASGVA